MENNYTYDWDSEINNESSEFVLLPEGDYDFTVEKFERGTFDGSDKLPSCKKAIVTFTIWGAEDKISITENFLLCSKLEWKLSSLFLSVGMKKHGEPLRMNWTGLVGQKGRCHVFAETGKNSDKLFNRIKKFYAYDEDVQTIKPASQPVQYNTTSSSGWQAGKF